MQELAAWQGPAAVIALTVLFTLGLVVLALWIASYMMVPVLTMGLMGKRLNQVARLSGAITVPDVIRSRFESERSALTAEIGLMRATNQIDAMELMAIDPVRRIALPRFAAGVLSVPLLTALFNAMAILGSVVFSIGVMDLDTGTFWSKLQTSVYFDKDLMHGIWKSVVFGGIVSLIAVYFGYYSKPTGAGVGTATTNTVVLSSVLVLVFDFIMTSFLT